MVISKSWTDSMVEEGDGAWSLNGSRVLHWCWKIVVSSGSNIDGGGMFGGAGDDSKGLVPSGLDTGSISAFTNGLLSLVIDSGFASSVERLDIAEDFPVTKGAGFAVSVDGRRFEGRDSENPIISSLLCLDVSFVVEAVPAGSIKSPHPSSRIAPSVELSSYDCVLETT